jgi:hypothetical protein
MTKARTCRHEFVEFIPTELAEGVIYVSIEYATAVHKCFCGCGSEVVTPIAPTDWEISFNGETVSLHPSVGSWSLPCRSHYWIVDNQIHWSYAWSSEEIEEARQADRYAKTTYYESKNATVSPASRKAQKGEGGREEDD